VIVGSILEVIPSEFIVPVDPTQLEAFNLPADTEYVYPIVFTADTPWTAELNMTAPAGYEITTQNTVDVNEPTVIFYVGLKKIAAPETSMNILQKVASIFSSKTYAQGTETMNLTVQAKHTNETTFKDQTVSVNQEPVVGTPADVSKVDAALNST
jgi:hypothetical protein